MQHIDRGWSVEGKRRGFDLWILRGSLRIRGMYQTGTHGPPICLPLDLFRTRLAARGRIERRSLPPYKARRFVIEFGARNTSIWIRDYNTKGSSDGFHVFCRTPQVTAALAREIRLHRFT